MNTNIVHTTADNGLSLLSPIFGLAFSRATSAPARGTLSRRELRKIVTDLIG